VSCCLSVWWTVYVFVCVRMARYGSALVASGMYSTRRTNHGTPTQSMHAHHPPPWGDQWERTDRERQEERERE
jgi:hypothetical protein